jgi:hypothetical protein
MTGVKRQCIEQIQPVVDIDSASAKLAMGHHSREIFAKFDML